MVVLRLDAGDIMRCQFERNTASAQGGGLHMTQTGGNVQNCTFMSNTAPTGAGIAWGRQFR